MSRGRSRGFVSRILTLASFIAGLTLSQTRGWATDYYGGRIQDWFNPTQYYFWTDADGNQLPGAPSSPSDNAIIDGKGGGPPGVYYDGRSTSADINP